MAPVCPRTGNRAGGPGGGRGGSGIALGSSLGRDAPQSHAGEPQPHALSIKGLNLTGLPLQQTPDPLGAPCLQGQQLLFHPLLQQCPPQSHPLLQLPQFSLVLTLRADLDLALVSIEQLQLLLKLLPKGLELCLLGLIKSQLEKRKERISGLASLTPTVLPAPGRPGPKISSSGQSQHLSR